MAMGSSLNDSSPDQPLAEINVTPLVDVMLVLLVIFILAAPLMAHALKVDLPQAEAPTEGETVVISLSIHADGRMTMDDEELNDTTLPDRLRERFHQKPKAVLRLDGDGDTPYRNVAKVLSIAQKIGMHRLAFTTASPPKP